MPCIEKVLWLSTAHIPPEAAAALNATPPEEVAGWSAYPLEYGWLLWIPDAFVSSNYSEAEPWLKRIYDFALSHGCTYIRFDCDEPEIAELPTFEW